MLEKLLRSTAEVKVLGVALFSEGLHLREIARRSGISPYEAKRELWNLLALGVLCSERRGNQLAFRTNKDCPFLQDLKNLYQKTEGVFWGLRDAMNDSEIGYAFVFGSSARGAERPYSDIDVLVIGDISEEKLADRIFRSQRDSGREINYILWTTNDLKEKISKKSSFLKNIISRDVVWLRGDRDEFIRIAGKRPRKKGRSG